MTLRRWFLPLALLVLLVAAALRLWALAQYPPGPHYDEAVYYLITRSIAFGGSRPFPIVEAYQGREVLYMYLNAPLLHLLGDRIFTLHLTNAFLNILTVAAALSFGRSMFPGRRGVIIGLVMGAALALSFPQIWLGRQAFRAVTLPFCQAFALLFLWRGLNGRRGGWGWLALGGLFAGLTLYTYMASRLFPFWLLLGGGALIVLDGRRRGLRLKQGLVFFGVLGVVGLPMAIYAVRNPDIFLGRLTEVTQADQSISLAESLLIHARMFFLQGEPYLRYNIPGRPYLTWPEGLLMLVGGAVALWRLVRSGRATERAAYLLALLSPLMVIPSVISVGGLPPNHMRSLGMIPLIFVLVAVGFEALWSRLAFRHEGRALTASLLAVLSIGGVLVGRAYFDWAGRADLYYESDGDLAAAAQWLPGQASENTHVYVAARDRGHPTVTMYPVPPIEWLGTDSLMLPPEGQRGLYVFPRSAPPRPEWLPLLEPGRITDLPLGPDGRTAFEAFALDGSVTLPEPDFVPDDALSNGYLTLFGSDERVIGAGSTGIVDTYWLLDGLTPPGDFTPLVQLEDANGHVLYRGDVYLGPTDQWVSGSRFWLQIPVTVPFATAPGFYQLHIAWISRGSNEYKPYAGGEVWGEVGQVEVIRPSELPTAEALNIPVREAHAITPDVRLIGYSPAGASARPGESLALSLFWEAVNDAPGSFDYRAVLRGEDGSQVVLAEQPPLAGDYPLSRWLAGEIINDHARWLLPRDLPGGVYRVSIETETAEVLLGELTITGLPRLFEPPAFDQSVGVDLGQDHTLHLLGYTLEPEGEGFSLTLVWYAQRPVDENYTVFVHAVDANGIIVGQRDVSPVDNTYPTSLWAEGEYVVDRHVLTTLNGPVDHLRVGLYSQETGERLPVWESQYEFTNYLQLPYFVNPSTGL